MRIALISQEYPPETAKGGIGTQTYAKAHGLADRGHDMIVVSRAPAGLASDVRDGLVRVIRIPGFEERMPVHTEIADWVTYSAAAAERIARLHEERALDLVEFPEWAAEGYVHLLNRTEWYRIPTAIHLHGPLAMFSLKMGWPNPDSEFFRTGTVLEATAVRLADAIVSSSHCSLDCVAEHYGRDPTNVPVLHTGIETEKFRPLDRPKPANPIIVFAGKLAANKGIFILLEAALSLVREIPDLRLRFLGRGADHVVAQLKKRVEEAGKPDLLDLPGFVPHGELATHLNEAYVFAAPSSYEPGPGLVNLEAMACGLPVVTTSGSGSAEVVQNEITGLLVPPGDVGALASALHRLLSSRETRVRFGENARAYVKREASTALCLDRFEAFYRSVIDGSHGQRGPVF